MLLTATKAASIEEAKKVTSLIAIRNRIVHEGFDPDFEAQDFHTVLVVIARLLGNTIQKFPSIDLGNHLDASPTTSETPLN